jgi:phosphatidylglycerol:prolipoprotein diacylglycerol transferase
MSIPDTIFAYRLFFVLAFIAGLKIGLIQTRENGIPDSTILYLSICILLSGTVGAHILYVLFYPAAYLRNPLRIFALWEGGRVFQGGLIGGVLGGIIFCKIKNLNVRKILDWSAPVIALGHVFGKLGCFFNGCCYGRPTNGWWAVVYNNIDCTAPKGVPVYPVQLQAALGNLFIFILLWKIRNKKHYSGQLFMYYIVLSSVLRFVDEFFRGDGLPGFVFGITVTQAVALVLIFAGILFHLHNRKNNEKRNILKE